MTVIRREDVIGAIHKQRGEFKTADIGAALGVHSRRVSGHMESLGDAGRLKRVRMEGGRYIWRHGSNWYVPTEQCADEVRRYVATVTGPVTAASVSAATGLNSLSAATALDWLRRRGEVDRIESEGLARVYRRAEPDDSEWLPTRAAAARLGIHRRTLQRRARTGQAETRTCADGTVEYRCNAGNAGNADAATDVIRAIDNLRAALERARAELARVGQ